MNTLNHTELSDPRTEQAFRAGFEKRAMGARRVVAPKSLSPSERFAFKSGAAWARMPDAVDRAAGDLGATKAFVGFLKLEGFWAGSACQVGREKIERGEFVEIVVG